MIRLFTIPGTHSSVKLGFPTYIHAGRLLADIRSDDVVVRWGNSDPVSARAAEEGCINNGLVIASNCDKRAALISMAEVVDTPRLYESFVPVNVKAVVRNYAHQRGEGFQIIDGRYTIPSGQYATKYINGKEFRSWFFKGKRSLSAMRVRRSGDDATCRSEWGYGFDVNFAPPEDAIQEAANAIGLHFGAADIIQGESDGRWYFLELNSAPALDHSKVINFFRSNIEEYYASRSH